MREGYLLPILLTFILPYGTSFSKLDVSVSLDDVDGIVAQFLALADDVHIVDTHLIVVLLVVDVGHVAVLQTGTVVIDFVLRVQALHRIDTAGGVLQQAGHLPKSTVAKLDHHGWKESTNGYFLKVLSPEVIVEMCSNREHPYSETLERMADPMSYESPRQFYITTEGSKERIERKDPALWQHFVPYHGHIVVRVYEGGRSYQVFVLDAKMPDYHVLYKSPVVNL